MRKSPPKETSGSGTDPINRVFARVEQAGVRAGVVLIVVGFVLYVTGMLPPFLSIEALIENWGLASAEFIERTGMPAGWGWVRLLGHGDMLALGGLILLSSVVVAAYVGMLAQWARQGNRAYLLLVVLQLGVFALAASGWLGGGH